MDDEPEIGRRIDFSQLEGEQRLIPEDLEERFSAIFDGVDSFSNVEELTPAISEAVALVRGKLYQVLTEKGLKDRKGFKWIGAKLMEHTRIAKIHQNLSNRDKATINHLVAVENEKAEKQGVPKVDKYALASEWIVYQELWRKIADRFELERIESSLNPLSPEAQNRTIIAVTRSGSIVIAGPSIEETSKREITYCPIPSRGLTKRTGATVDHVNDPIQIGQRFRTIKRPGEKPECRFSSSAVRQIFLAPQDMNLENLKEVAATSMTSLASIASKAQDTDIVSV